MVATEKNRIREYLEWRVSENPGSLGDLLVSRKSLTLDAPWSDCDEGCLYRRISSIRLSPVPIDGYLKTREENELDLGRSLHGLGQDAYGITVKAMDHLERNFPKFYKFVKALYSDG